MAGNTARQNGEGIKKKGEKHSQARSFIPDADSSSGLYEPHTNL